MKCTRSLNNVAIILNLISSIGLIQRTSADLSEDYLNELRQNYLKSIALVSNKSSDIIYDNCNSYLKAYGKESSEFIKCSIERARPFRLCEKCVVNYQKAVQVFADIYSNDEQKDGCRALLLDSDRVAVLNQVHSNILKIWLEADCKNCFSEIKEDKNGTVVYSLSESTKRFLHLYENISQCIDWNQNITIPMNYTRLMWGKTLHCSRRFPDDLPIILMASFLGCVPIVFYCCSWYFAGEHSKIILKQKRMPKRLRSIYGTYDVSETDGLLRSTSSSPS
ncbi:hypothetical protein KUTeg_007482 [Tegillarca granosa]|uniref:Osteopetrosis-associated transmembrane protein 1 n=1 Tax=Tegillarca granosa TaxID=220873 RepID=A0ABQ9FFQ0_TEGGR|nr:hypothetical protein KUTeg_007482 [Tegillarca granosa]